MTRGQGTGIDAQTHRGEQSAGFQRRRVHAGPPFLCSAAEDCRGLLNDEGQAVAIGPCGPLRPHGQVEAVRSPL